MRILGAVVDSAMEAFSRFYLNWEEMFVFAWKMARKRKKVGWVLEAFTADYDMSFLIFLFPFLMRHH